MCFVVPCPPCMVQVIYPPYYNMPCIKHQTASVSTPCSVVFHMIGKNSLSLPTSTRSACIRLSLHALPLLVPRTLPNMAWAVFGSTLHTTHLHPHVCGAHHSPSISSNVFLPMPIPMDNLELSAVICGAALAAQWAPTPLNTFIARDNTPALSWLTKGSTTTKKSASVPPTFLSPSVPSYPL